MDTKREDAETKSPDFTNILLLIIVAIVSLVIFIIYQRNKTVRKDVLLTGLCDSGKTLLFARLVYKNFVNTQTSIKENVSEYTINKVSLRIVDLPGHERLRYKYFDQYKNTTKLVAYVIDSVTIQKEIRDVAEYLYNILTDPVILKNATQVAVVCNKQDLPLAKGCNAIKSILERELNTLRVTKSNQLDSVDQKGKKVVHLGREGEDFDFASLPLNVDFIETTIANNKKDSLNLGDFEKILLKVS